MLSRAVALSSRTTLLIGGLITAFWLAVYSITVSPTVNFIDSGELITALHEPGIAHPPGYPLYTLMGYVVSHVPLGEVAWRVNMFSAFWGAAATGALYLLVVAIGAYTAWLNVPKASPAPSRRKASRALTPAPAPVQQSQRQTFSLTFIVAGVAAAALLGASSTFWNRTTQAKMYTLHYSFVLVIFLLALLVRWAYERGDTTAASRYSVALAAIVGFSLTNHLMTVLLLPGIALLVLVRKGWQGRLDIFLIRWKFMLPAFLLPLLLYLYLPIRSSQGPVMNWGSPDNWPDLWRHITAWQFRAYVQNDVGGAMQRIWGYITGQWNFLTAFVLLLALAAGAMLARTNLALFLATLTTAVATILFALVYGISEIEPYLVPLYIMLAIWLGTAPISVDSIFAAPGGAPKTMPNSSGQAQALGLGVAGILVVVAAVSGLLQFPGENHNNDHLAELFVGNTFNNLEKDSIIITDHWDFQSPSYYMQMIRQLRPDIAIVDKSSLRYPWYLGQLEKRYPWIVSNSGDIAQTFRSEQHKWVNSEPFNPTLLQQSYIDLLNSFIDRNIAKHPAYIFFRSFCNPALEEAENKLIGQKYAKQLSGFAYRLLPQAPPAGTVPPEPNFDLRGYLQDRVPFDEVARFNGECYANAYTLAAQEYSRASQPDKARQLLAEGAAVRSVVQGP